MGEMNRVVFGLILAGLIGFAIISFAFQFGVDNQTVVNILDEPSFNSTFGDLKDELNTVQSNSETNSQTLTTGNTKTDSGEITFDNIVDITSSILSFPKNFYNLIVLNLSNFWGVPPIVLNVISGIMIILLALVLWKILRTGDS